MVDEDQVPVEAVLAGFVELAEELALAVVQGGAAPHDGADAAMAAGDLVGGHSVRPLRDLPGVLQLGVQHVDGLLDLADPGDGALPGLYLLVPGHDHVLEALV